MDAIMPQPPRDVVASGRPRRIIEMRLSLEWCLGIFGAGVLCAFTLWFNVQQLTKTVEALTIAVNSGNNAYGVLAGKLTLLEYRMGMYDEAFKRLQERNGNKP